MEVGDRVHIITDDSFNGRIGTVSRVSEGDYRSVAVDLDSEDTSYGPLMFDPAELTELELLDAPLNEVPQYEYGDVSDEPPRFEVFSREMVVVDIDGEGFELTFDETQDLVDKLNDALAGDI